MSRPSPKVIDLGPARASGLPDMPRFHMWRGRSQSRYMTAVHEATLAEPAENSVMLLVAVSDGDRSIRSVLTFGTLDGGSEQRLRRALAASGANEAHVHLLARTEAARAAVVRDLAPISRHVAAARALGESRLT